jgi:hypothetical protein
MAYGGKATYTNGLAVEIAEDVSDLVSLNAKVETPFLDFLGNPAYPARSVKHEWLEDAVLANTDQLNEALDNSETDVDVDTGTVFRVGDIIMIEDEVMLVTAISTNTLTVTRGYGSSTAATHADNTAITILGNAALEGGDADAAKASNRSRVVNYTQIIRPATLDVSFTEQAVTNIGIANEYEHQKELRVLEAMRMLENTVIHGRVAASTPQGSGTVRRSMKGLKQFCSSNVTAAGGVALTESYMNSKLESAYNNGAYDLDFILAGGTQKRKISQFISAGRRYTSAEEAMKTRVAEYESDFGVLKVILCRWIPSDQIVFGSSKWIEVLPLEGRSFAHYPLAVSGSYDKGMIEGEYTLEVKHEEAHGYIDGLAT